MSELHSYVGITGIKGGRKMEKCVRNISHYGDRSCSSFIKKQIIFPLDVNSSLHSVIIYQSSDVLLWIRNCVWSWLFLIYRKAWHDGLSGRKYIHLPISNQFAQNRKKLPPEILF